MALKSNVFTSDFKALNQRLVMLVGYQGFTEWQLSRAKASILKDFKTFEEKGWDKHAYFAGHSLSIVNVLHDGEWITRTAGGGTVTRGEDILMMSDEMSGRFNAFMLVYVFEAIEKYITALYGKLLYQLRSEQPLKNKASFHNARQNITKTEGTPEYYRAYAEWSCGKNCDNALTAFKKQVDLNRIRVLVGGISLLEYFHLIAYLRHCIVHNEGRIDDAGFRRLSLKQQQLAGGCVHNTVHGNDIMILPTNNIIDRIFEYSAGYGLALYLLLTERCGMKDDFQYFKSQKTRIRDSGALDASADG